MNCVVIDDEPLAREAIISLIHQIFELELVKDFSSADAASRFLETENIDLIFLDIDMPGTDGLTFAQQIPRNTMVIFTTAYSQYASDSYEIDAVDYLIKPIRAERFQRAVAKAISYKRLIEADAYTVDVSDMQENYFFIRAERKMYKVFFNDILFIQGLKDYVVLQMNDQKVITAMNIKTIQAKLPQNIFIRTSKSYIINKHKIDSFDNNTVYIDQHEIPIGLTYHTAFFEGFVTQKLIAK